MDTGELICLGRSTVTPRSPGPSSQPHQWPLVLLAGFGRGNLGRREALQRPDLESRPLGLIRTTLSYPLFPPDRL